MKVMILVAAAFVLAVQPATSQQQKMDKACGDYKTASIEVNTAKCEMCVDKITKALQALHAVHSVDVDLEKKMATVEYCAMCTNVAKMEKAITNAGYNANKMERNPKAYEQLPSCCR